ncbi:MAG: hypothetical protein KIS66_10185 [Fimbriimonadaceae bacterium]|nr:hypothetical protein [Fimbriimonadaceae bacterium]
MERARLIAAILEPGASAAEARRLAAEVSSQPELLGTVVELSGDATTGGRTVAFAVFKSLAETRPDLLGPARKAILAFGGPEEPWVVPLLAGQAAARMAWPDDWRERVRAAFLPYLESSNRFVRAWALSALWRVTGPDDPFASRLEEEIDRCLGAGGALAARARALLAEREESANRSGNRRPRSR